MIAQATSTTYTPADYLAIETDSETRHEYINGEIIPMSGGTPNHNRIIRNLCTLTTLKLPKEYEVFVSDQRLWIPDYQVYTYPDVMIVKGDLILQEERKDTITNPLVIIEVLSESTANYDRSQKFSFYRSISTFQEYILIDQYAISLQHYHKISDKKWEFEEFNQPTDEVQFKDIPCIITMADIYEKVAFTDSIEEA